MPQSKGGNTILNLAGEECVCGEIGVDSQRLGEIVWTTPLYVGRYL